MPIAGVKSLNGSPYNQITHMVVRNPTFLTGKWEDSWVATTERYSFKAGSRVYLSLKVLLSVSLRVFVVT